MDEGAPTAATLYNYDINGCGKEFPGNNDTGLTLNKTANGLSESDLGKHQVWRTSKLDSDLVISGDVTIDFWASVKNPLGGDLPLFQNVTAYLRDFTPEIGNGSVFDADWQGGPALSSSKP